MVAAIRSGFVPGAFDHPTSIEWTGRLGVMSSVMRLPSIASIRAGSRAIEAGSFV